MTRDERNAEMRRRALRLKLERTFRTVELAKLREQNDKLKARERETARSIKYKNMGYIA